MSECIAREKNVVLSVLFKAMVKWSLTLARLGFFCPVEFRYLNTSYLLLDTSYLSSPTCLLHHSVLICSVMLYFRETSPKIQGRHFHSYYT